MVNMFQQWLQEDFNKYSTPSPVLKKKPILPPNVTIKPIPLAPRVSPIKTTPLPISAAPTVVPVEKWMDAIPTFKQDTTQDYQQQAEQWNSMPKDITSINNITQTPDSQQKESYINFTLADLSTDIKNWMPIEELANHYIDVPTSIVGDLYTDIKNGMPISDAKKYYPELDSIQVWSAYDIPKSQSASDILRSPDENKWYWWYIQDNILASWIDAVDNIKENYNDPTQWDVERWFNIWWDVAWFIGNLASDIIGWANKNSNEPLPWSFDFYDKVTRDFIANEHPEQLEEYDANQAKRHEQIQIPIDNWAKEHPRETKALESVQNAFFAAMMWPSIKGKGTSIKPDIITEQQKNTYQANMEKQKNKSENISVEKSNLSPDLAKVANENPYINEEVKILRTNIEKWQWEPSLVRDARLNEEIQKLKGAVDEKISNLKDTWPLIWEVKNNPKIEDMTPAKTWIDNIIKNSDIIVNSDWKLDFSKSGIGNTSDQNVIQKAYDRVKSLPDNAPIKEIINTKQALWDMKNDFNRQHPLVKRMYGVLAEHAHNTNEHLAKTDKLFSDQIKELNEIKIGLFDKDWNLQKQAFDKLRKVNNPKNAEFRAKIEKYFPWLVDRVEAINTAPDILKEYNKPKGLTKMQNVWVKVAQLWIAWLVQHYFWAWFIDTLMVEYFLKDSINSLFANKLTWIKQKNIDAILSRISPEKIKAASIIEDRIRAWEQATTKQIEDIAKLREEIESSVKEEFAKQKEQATKQEWMKKTQEVEDKISNWLPYDSKVNTEANTTILPRWKTIIWWYKGNNTIKEKVIDITPIKKSELPAKVNRTGKKILPQWPKQLALPEKTTNNIGTEKNPIVAKDPRKVIEIDKRPKKTTPQKWLSPKNNIDTKWLKKKSLPLEEWIKKTETTNNPMQIRWLPEKNYKKNIDWKNIIWKIKWMEVVDYGNEWIFVIKWWKKVWWIQFDEWKSYLKEYPDYAWIRQITVDENIQWKWIGTDLYKIALENLPDNKKWIIWINNMIRDDKVKSIYKKLGAKTDKNGNYILDVNKNIILDNKIQPKWLPTRSIKSKVDIVNKEPIKVYRWEWKGIGNSTFVKWKYFADSKDFASTFGDVTEHTIPKWQKIFNFDAIKDNPNQNIIPQKILVDPNATTNLLIEKWYDYTKNTNSRWVEYVKLDRNLYDIKDLAKRMDEKEFVNKILNERWDDMKPKYQDWMKQLERMQNRQIWWIPQILRDLWKEVNKK